MFTRLSKIFSISLRKGTRRHQPGATQLTLNVNPEAWTQVKDPQSFLDASLKFGLFPVTFLRAPLQR